MRRFKKYYIAIFFILLANVGTSFAAEKVEVIFDLPEDVCYVVDSLETSLDSEFEISYSSNGAPSYSWTHTPQANQENADCNVRAFKISLNSDNEELLSQVRGGDFFTASVVEKKPEKVEQTELESTLSTTSTIVTGVTIVTSATSTMSVFLARIIDLPPLLSRGWYALLVLFRFRKKGVPFGQVFDSKSMDPLSQAILRIYDKNGRLVRTDISGFNGVFYSYLPDGEYKAVVAKGGYTFPSQLKLSNWNSEHRNIYRGGVFYAEEETEVNLGIPIDSDGVERLGRARLFIRESLLAILSKAMSILFIVGIVISAVVAFMTPTIENIGVLFIYVPFLLLYVFVKRSVESVEYGYIVDQNGTPLSDIQVALVDDKFEKILAERVSNSKGGYRFIVKPGNYRIGIISSVYQMLPEKYLHVSADKENYVLKPTLILTKKETPS